MDPRYLKRFLLLEYLHINQNHSIELMKLCKLVNVSYPTVKKIIAEIKSDIEELGYEDHVELIDLFEQNKVMWNVKKNFPSTIFRVYYLEQSYRFRLFSLFIEPKEWTISELTKKMNITYAMVKKELGYLVSFIQANAKNLMLNNERKISLVGDEVTIRLLYTGVFQQVYGGYKWPFMFISMDEVSEILEPLEGEMYQKFSPRYFSIHFGLAISLLRANRHTVPNNAYYWWPNNNPEQKAYDTFLRLLRKKRPMIHFDHLKLEARFFISCVTANSAGRDNGKLPLFFMNSPDLQKINFLQWVDEKVQTIEKYALKEMTKQEREQTSARVVSIFYQMLIYRKALQQRMIDLFVHHPFDFPGNKERERTFYHIFMSNCSEQLDTIDSGYIEYLCASYYRLLFFELSRHLFHPRIRIFSISNRTPEVLISTKIPSIGSYFHLEVVKVFDEEVDLILTDMALSRQMKNALARKIPMVYLNEAYCPKDNELLQETLTKIADKKYRKIKIENGIEEDF